MLTHDSSPYGVPRLTEPDVRIRDEHFWIYVPNGEPPKDGYGLLVFIPPWEEGSIPAEWRRGQDLAWAGV